MSDATGRVLHPRAMDCPRCGATAGKPCRLPTGKVLLDIHCTVRVTGRDIEPSWMPPKRPSADATSTTATLPEEQARRLVDADAEPPAEPPATTLEPDRPKREAGAPGADEDFSTPWSPQPALF